MSGITTVDIKSLGKTHITIEPDQLISKNGLIVGVELSNEVILFAAEQIKSQIINKGNLSTEYDADAILFYAISHAMAGIDAADKRHCELAVSNVKKAIRDNRLKFLPLVTP